MLLDVPVQQHQHQRQRSETERYRAVAPGQIARAVGQQDGGQGDDAVAAHGAEAAAVDKEGSEMRVAALGWSEDAAVHFRMAAGFKDEGAADVVEVLIGIAPAFEQIFAAERGQAAENETEGLSGGMGVDGLNFQTV